MDYFTQDDVNETEEKSEISVFSRKTSSQGNAMGNLPNMENAMVNLSDTENLKRKYGQVYQVDTVVEEDDENEGSKLRFFFKKPNVASFNRYLKTASKNMAVSTSTFVLDNIVDEQRELLEEKSAQYPGLALGIGTKLLSALGLSDNVNFKKL